MIVCGGGQHNGMLLGLIAQQFSDLPVHRLDDLGLADAALDSQVAAELANHQDDLMKHIQVLQQEEGRLAEQIEKVLRASDRAS